MPDRPSVNRNSTSNSVALSTRRRLKLLQRFRDHGYAAPSACKRCLSEQKVCIIMLPGSTKCEICTRQGKECSFRPLDDLEKEYLETKGKLQKALRRQREGIRRQEALRAEQREVLKKASELSLQITDSSTEVQSAMEEVSSLLEASHDAEEMFRRAINHEESSIMIDLAEASGVSGIDDMLL